MYDPASDPAGMAGSRDKLAEMRLNRGWKFKDDAARRPFSGRLVHLARGSAFFTLSRSAFAFAEIGAADFVPPDESEAAPAFLGSGLVPPSPQPIATIGNAKTRNNHLNRLIKIRPPDRWTSIECDNAPRGENIITHGMAEQ